MARTPMPAPVPLESPAVRRSAMLAKLLEESRQPTEIKGGYGELGARLLAQGINQFGANRADKAVTAENEAKLEAQRAALSAALGGGSALPTPMGAALAPAPAAPPIPAPPMPTNTQEPISSPIAPAAQIAGGPLPGVGEPMPAPMPVPQAPTPAAPQQPQIPAPLRAQIELLMAQGDIPGATALLGEWNQQQALMAGLPEEIRNDPIAAWAAVNNPGDVAGSFGKRFAPIAAAEGTAIQTGGPGGGTTYNPRTFVAGGEVLQTGQGGGVNPVRDVAPTYADITGRYNADTSRITAERPQAVTTSTGAVTSLIGPNGEVQGQIQGREALRPPVQPSAANIELQGRIDSTARETLPTINQMKTLLSSGDIITGFGATARLDAARALAALGNQDAQRQVAATQQYQNLSGGLRVALAKSLGANPSNADILLLEKVTAGDIGQSPEALLATVQQAEQRASGLVNDLQRQLATTAPQSVGGNARPRATNPQTGQVVEFDGQAWVPVR